MRKFLSIFMSVVMVVAMLPKVSFAEEPPVPQNEKCHVPQNEECPVGGVQDTFFQFVGLVKERAPQVWEKIKPYVDKGTNWGKDYYNNASEFASKVGILGVAATMGLSTLVVKVVWKVLKFIVALFDDNEPGQSGGYDSNSNSSYSANCGQAATYIYPTDEYQTPYSYMS